MNLNMNTDIENPLHVEIIPLAEIVNHRLEVEGQIVVETIKKEYTYCDRIRFYIELSGIILLGFGILAAFILFLIWIYNPDIFGTY